MEKKHTSGPWGIMMDGPVGDGKPWTACLESAPGLTVASSHNTEPICRISGYCQPVEANAYLIAASPKLLQACETVANEMQSASSMDAIITSPWLDRRIRILREAISEAKGKRKP